MRFCLESQNKRASGNSCIALWQSIHIPAKPHKFQQPHNDQLYHQHIVQILEGVDKTSYILTMLSLMFNMSNIQRRHC